ncbi:MAG: hypothetical protein KF838_01030 [Phycisphaeraceae bacterium]|nr:MAG: hypothetical protein KF838_01030 [Phycisphaeraceae bacterium]
MQRRRSRLISAALLTSLAPLAHAQLHDGDIILTIDSNTITTNDASTGSIIPSRVFATTFGSFDFTDSPGFDTPGGTFPPSSQIGFNVLRALQRWNGSAFPMDASGIPAERLRIRKTGFGDVFTPTIDTFTPGFGIPVSSGGEFHQHVGFTLQSPNGAGIYLLELELWSSVPSILTSEPFWILFNNDLPLTDLESATQWVLDNLLTQPCAADVNGDTTSDILDFLDFLDSFGSCENLPSPCAGSSGIDADFNGDTFVDILDFLDFFDAFGTGCP